MTFIHFKEADGLRAFASLNMPNTFKFVIDNHSYYMPTILADFISPAVAAMHLTDPTLNFFLISDISDQNLDFELFMILARGGKIEITPENSPFIEIVASKLMNEEIVKISSDFLNNLSPLTIENAVFRLNQKKSVGILPIRETQFIAENFWVINPIYLFQIQYKDLNLILSNPKLKILDENWLFCLILKIIEDKGEKYRMLLSYVSFQNLNMNSIQSFFEKTNLSQVDEYIFRSVRERFSSKNDNNSHQYHIMANQSEINYVYQKSKNQKDYNGYSFNTEFFKENRIYQDQNTFDYISKLFDNSPTLSTSSFIYNFNNKFNPFEPNPKKPFPDYYSRINSIKDNENKENKRNPLIQDEVFPFSNWPVNIHYSDKSERIPVNFTNTDNFSFSSDDEDDESSKENANSSESFFNIIANQVFHNSQKIFDQKATEKNNNETNKENQSRNGFFSSFINGFLSIFTPIQQEGEPENIIPREEELTSFKPEPIVQNRNENDNERWPSPSPSNNDRNRNNNNNIENGDDRLIANENDNNESTHVTIHQDSSDDNNKILINTNNENNNTNVSVTVNGIKEPEKAKNKSDDDSDLDGYGGFVKEQY